jgi:NAD(P)-dependent dehydrogenase (short-subunit alcohol dehydrogenase family)
LSDNTHRTALVTGASSGLGFEAAAQLAEAGYERVIITARTDAKADEAQAHLRSRTGGDPFETLTIDLDDHGSIAAAVETLAALGGKIDLLLLNAGIAPTKGVTRTAEGIEAIVAATLTGHHLLTMRLLGADLLSAEARIIMAGSEAARGDVPMFEPMDIDALATESFDGDREAAIGAVMRMDPPLEYHGGNQYATVKMFAVWWAAELAEKLPPGMTVNVVSPGSTPDTNAVRNASFMMKRVMLPVLKIVPGMSHTVETGAGRYLEAADFGPEQTGKFYASKPKKMTGPLHEIQLDDSDLDGHDNVANRQALWNVTSEVSGGVEYPA